VRTNTNTRSSQPNQASGTPDFSYPLLSSIAFPSSSPISLFLSSKTQPSSQNTKLSHPSLSLHDMIMSWHRVQHTPSTASTQDCFSSLHSHDYKVTPECSFSFRRTSLHNRPPSASSPWELKGKVTLSHSHGWELPNWWIESHHPVRRPSTASKYSSKLAWSRLTSVSPNSIDYGLQVRTSMASKCISRLTRSRSRSASLSSLDHSLLVHLQTRSITASEYISEFTRSSFSGAPRIALKHRLQPVLI